MPDAIDSAFETLRAYALTFPDSYEDHPWGESAIKVGKKAFVFMSMPDEEKYGFSFGITVKLPLSAGFAESLPFAQASGYGLGKYGWITAQFKRDDEPPVDLLEEWIEESYRTVAPKKLVEQFDAQLSTQRS